MQLFLDYEHLLMERLNEYIGNEFLTTIIGVLRKLHGIIENNKERRKNQLVVTDCEESQPMEV